MESALQTLETVSQIIPQDLGLDSHRKREYIKWRVCGFSPKEARDYVGLVEKVVDQWFTEPLFSEAMNNVMNMSTEVFDILMEQEERKNRARSLAIDGRVLDTALTQGVGNVDDKTFDYLKGIKKGMDMPQSHKAALNLTLNNMAPRSVSEMLEQVEAEHASEAIKRRKGDKGTEESDVHIIEGESVAVEYKESAGE